ncbi:MAG: NAD(P)/FAD-dependent oxidoreductase [Cyclobacteriaceae bacterium]|nr:NAD(P)/FAD-dependent oxidoreductase [Cyclobacteriaceae bacterium]UYN86913.1 MAG: NAD(P)/FAD-dependent oxidoreductase [Cyclobacteriaceae bacterium]
MSSKDVVVAGGGLAGLIASIRLVRAGIHCTLIEKKRYPFHRVCGEYISNETVPFLKREELFPEAFSPPVINQFHLSSVSGKSTKLSLDLGGFGISRFTLDHFLYQQALQAGVNFVLEQEVDSISFLDREDSFTVRTSQQEFSTSLVIGAFGKRSRMDTALKRGFIQKRSPYVGVKYHIQTDHPANLIALHNFNGGYCGISNIEDRKTNLCYLVHRDQVKRFKGIREMEEAVLFQNPSLKSIFNSSEFLFEKPETINEISFETKEPVFNHILMAGDAAGMIAPLCGNGMAMAIHTGKIVSDLIIEAKAENRPRAWLEAAYAERWTSTFATRLRTGRLIQNYLFGSAWSSRVAVNLAVHSTWLANQIIKKTHGVTF